MLDFRPPGECVGEYSFFLVFVLCLSFVYEYRNLGERTKKILDLNALPVMNHEMKRTRFTKQDLMLF